MKKFFVRLRELRLKNNLSQNELAKQLGVSPITIFRWENKINLPKINKIADVAIFFHVKVDYLIGLKD